MAYLIAATDFTDISLNAVNYACGMAMDLGMKLVLFHSYMPPLMVTEVPVAPMSWEEARDNASDHIGNLMRKLKEGYPGIEMECSIYDGDLTDGLIDYVSDKVKPVLVVIGNSNDGASAHWLDSKLVTLFRHLGVPALAIPATARYHAPEAICFAYDNQAKGSVEAVRLLANIMSYLPAELHVLIAQDDVENRDNLVGVNDPVLDELKALNPKYHYEYNTNIEQLVAHVSGAVAFDWLVIIPRHHSLIGSIFHHSHTKRLAHSIHLPLLALPEHAGQA